MLSLKLRYSLELSAEDFRLILAALHEGLSDEQIQPALELQARLAKSRMQQMEQMVKSAIDYAKKLG